MLIGGVNNSQQAGQGIVPLVAQINKNAAEQTQQANSNAVEDMVELSYASRQKAREEQKNSQADLEMLLQQLENAKAQGKAMGSMMEERIKCLRIAMNIMSGDKVPDEDIRFLAEKDPEMFARSMSLRRLNEDPQECERVSEDEEEESGDSGENGASAVGGGGKSPAPADAATVAPAAESAPAADGGAESVAE